jgi:hypothetical protein
MIPIAMGSQVMARGVRGLTIMEALAPGVTLHIDPDVLDQFRLGVPLKPGEETPISVRLAGVPTSVTVHRMTATVRVGTSATAPAPQSATVGITPDPRGGDDGVQYKVDVAPLARPRNVEIKLSGGDVLWAHGAVLSEDSYTLPDFAAQVNDYLDRLPAGTGDATLVFLVKSDTPGQLAISIDADQYTLSRLQTESWPSEVDGALRVDRTFDLDFGTVVDLPLAPIAAPAGRRVVLQRVSVDVAGDVGPERLLAGSAAPRAGEQATVSPDYFLAQPLTPPATLQGAGVSGLFTVDGATKLYVELQPDADGRPATGPPLAKTELELAPADPPEGARRQYAAFESPAALDAAHQYWMVVRGVQGVARVALRAATAGSAPLLVSRGGQTWKPIDGAGATRSTAALDLVYTPGADNRTVAVDLRLEGGNATPVATAEGFDPQPAVAPIVFEPVTPPPRGPLRLTARSRARGRLTLANVMQEYELA